MRRTIAQRLTASTQNVPHFYLTMDCDIGKLMSAREDINASAPKDSDGKPAYKLSVNDFVIKALALALQRIPDANVSWTEAGMLKHRHSDIGVAVALPGRTDHTDRARRRDKIVVYHLERNARSRGARPRSQAQTARISGRHQSSVSNLGMYGIKDFTAVINPPQSTILAVGVGEERAVVATAKDRRRHHHERDAVLRSPRGRRRTWRRAVGVVQETDRKSGDDGGLTLTPDRIPSP